MSDTVWTDDKIQQAVDLFHIGWSASRIAHALGEDFSRNSIIGKLSRLGFKGKDRPAFETPREKWRPPKHTHTNTITLPEIKVHVPIPARPASSYKKGFAPRKDPVVTVSAPVSEPVTLMERTGCAYPTNDGRPFKFCNHETEGHSPYCAFHRQSMFIPLRAA